LGAWGSFLGAIAALGALGLPARQLKGLIKQLKQGSFVALLALETAKSTSTTARFPATGGWKTGRKRRSSTITGSIRWKAIAG
ncbi:MAG: hypothetical protein LC808_16840, partial [Actinobacteria bacterium]|nr:hypothetical protein [Actinomycetota bacterium]